MKLRNILMMTLVIFAGCSKGEKESPITNNPKEPVNNDTSSVKRNVIIINDNGQTFTSAGYAANTVVDSTVWGVFSPSAEPNYGSVITLNTSGDKMPFKLKLQFRNGPSNGIGSYTRYGNYQVLEYSTASKYSVCDSASAIVTSATYNPRRFAGSFYVHFNDGSIQHEVTGTFDLER